MKRMEGIVTALITPFNKEGKVDESNWRSLVRFQKDKVDGLFSLGTSGEGLLISLSQRKRALEILVDENNGKLPVIAHVGCLNTEDSIELAKHAVSNNVDIISAITPVFFKANDETLIRHLENIEKFVGNTPFFLYNNPSLSGNDISNNVVEYFNKNVCNFQGIKDSSKSIEKLIGYKSIVKDKTVLVGGDRIVYQSLLAGIDGAVSTLSNVFPELFTNLYKAALKEKDNASTKDNKDASYYQNLINKILNILNTVPYFSAIKELLSLRVPEMSFSYCKKPILDLNEEQKQMVRQKILEFDEIGGLINDR